MIGDAASLERTFARSAAATKSWGDKMDAAGKKAQAVGRTLSTHLTLPIVAAGAASVKLALDYDQAMNHVQALTGASAKQTQQWSDQILSLAPKIGQTPQQLAEALYFVASSGAKVNQVLPITVAAAKDAAAGMGDAQTVAQLLTSAMNAYGPAALSAAKASDILTEAVKVGKAEPAELAQNLGKVIPVAQTMGVTFAEVATATSELTNTGLNAAQAATGVRAILTGLIKPASQTSDEFKKLGTSVGGVQQEIRQKGLLATLDDLKARVGDNKQAMGQLFPNVRALTAFLALTGKNSAAAAAALDKVEHSTGAANKAFAVAASGPAFKLHSDLAQLEATGIKLGNDLLPAVIRVAGGVGHLADEFSHLSSGKQDLILYGAGVLAAVGPLTSIFGGVARAVGLASRAFRVLVPAEQAAAAASTEASAAAGAGGLGGALRFLGPAGLAAAGAMAVYYHSTQPNVHISRELAAAQADVKAKLDSGAVSARQYNNVIRESQHVAGNAQAAYRALAKSGIDVGQAHSMANQNVRVFVHQMGQAAVQAERAAGSNSHLAASAQAAALKAAAYARAARILAQSIDAIPSRKDVDIYLRTHEIIYGTQRYGAPPATTTGGAHPSVVRPSQGANIHVHVHGSVIDTAGVFKAARRGALVAGRRGTVRSDILERTPLVTS